VAYFFGLSCILVPQTLGRSSKIQLNVDEERLAVSNFVKYFLILALWIFTSVGK